MLRIRKSICITVLLVLTGSSSFAQVAPLEPNGIELLAEYFDMLVSGNFESAKYLWTEPIQERAGRFGIRYTDIVVRSDCSSPIVRDLDLMSDYLQPPAKKIDRLPNSPFTRLEYSAVVGGQLVTHTYWAVRDGEYFWLTHPQEYYGREWPVVESRLLRIHVHPEIKKYLNPVALEAADRYVEKMCRLLNIDMEQMIEIESKKIEYFYCDSDQTVKEITGARIKGTLDLATNDIISAFFPHFHELSHLLVNIKLRELPLYTLPLIREGAAVHFGGRWGKAPTALIDLASFIHREKIVEVDSLLAMSDFQRLAVSDIAYPVAGLFVQYLIDDMGLEAFMKLYREFSGTFTYVNLLSSESVGQKIADALRKDSWAKVARDFGSYIEKRLTRQAKARPGGKSGGKVLVKGDGMRVWENGDWLVFEFSGDSQDELRGNLLFAPDNRFEGASSLAFDEQYRDAFDFQGYRYGVQFDKNEAGLYDYGSNQLVAKYIWGISPSDDYFDAENNKIRVRFRKELVKDNPPTDDNYKLLAR